MGGRVCRTLKEVSKMSVKAYAAANMETCWRSIDFRETEYRIKKLQSRLAQAYQDGAYGKVKALQQMLIHSKEAKALAVKTVTSNKGKNTPGVDGVLWATPEDKWNAIFDLRRRGYNPLPLKRVYIPKSNGEERPLSIPTMKDRAMQTLYKFALEPIAEATADPHSYGFRRGKCTRDAINRCVEVLTCPENAWVLEADINTCFDNLSQDWVMEHIPMDKEILRKFLESGFIEQGKWNPTEQGIPQGGSISAVICNMALDGLESEVDTACRSKVHFIRYADDFIVIGANKELLEGAAKQTIVSFLEKRGLELSPKKKTAITHIEDGFDFLGWNVRRDGNQILVEPSKKNLSSFLGKIGNVVKRNPHSTYEQRWVILTPIIVGWVNYHRDVITSSSLSRVASDVKSCLEE